MLVLYLPGLGGVGLLGPDEPRYVSIGREMARSGDWITPRLDGEPWFEKPPLLYWMVAAGRLMRLPDEWAARLPVALASIAFLIFFFRVVMREFSERTAVVATAILATSVGWLAYSFAALTDLPMSAALSGALFLAIFDPRRSRGYQAGAWLGVSVLAKGLVPLVLFVPALLVARGKRWAMIAACVAVAAPWYVLCWVRNGPAFWNDFFWKQHVERFFSPALEHAQPLWYYIPVILAGLFPWTPLAALLLRHKTYEDARVRFLTAWLLFGFLFFSVARNKLPGYLLPLMPALAIVLAVAVEKAKGAQWWLAVCGLLLVALPSIAAVLPEALLAGMGKTPLVFRSGLYFAAAAPVAWWLARKGNSSPAVLAIAVAVIGGVVYVKRTTFPMLDDRVSVRAFWRANQTRAAEACLDNVRRDWVYGLNYYAGHALAECGAASRSRIVVRDGKLALVE